MAHTICDRLRSLHTADIDALHGYEEARNDAEGGGMTPLFQELIVAHTKNADELAIELRKSGEPVGADEGSFMSTVNKTIMSVRSLLGGLGESVLPGLIDGEKRIIAHYDDVLGSPDLSEDARALLLRNRARLTAEIDRLEIARG